MVLNGAKNVVVKSLSSHILFVIAYHHTNQKTTRAKRVGAIGKTRTIVVANKSLIGTMCATVTDFLYPFFSIFGQLWYGIGSMNNRR